MSRSIFTKDDDPVVLIDTMEKRLGKWAPLAKALFEDETVKTIEKDADACREYLGLDCYAAWGDYVIVFPEGSPIHPKGCIIGIERKGFSDAYDSTVSGRLNDQLAELMGACEGRAILLIEPFKTVPKALRVPAFRYKKAVHTKARKISFIMPVWWPLDTDQAVSWIKDILEHGWNYEIEGRGWNVKRVGGKIKTRKVKEAKK